jgi:hypothetical protein
MIHGTLPVPIFWGIMEHQRAGYKLLYSGCFIAGSHPVP